MSDLLEKIPTRLGGYRQLITHLNRMYHTRLGRLDYNPDGIDLLAEDWDFCLLLDACRYDMFADQYKDHLPEGDLSCVTSSVSNTSELVRSSFSGTHHDTVYVTANPMLARYRKNSDVSFHAEINVWEDAGWNEEYRTVLPQTMAEYTHDAIEKFPEKRLLVHFMQPHAPFITNDTKFDKSVPDIQAEDRNFWLKLRWGQLDLKPADIWAPYRANLDEVLSVVGDLLRELPGKSVVTSDHGNYVGERSWPIPIREWGHPRGVYTAILTDVPWFVRSCGSRRSTTEDEPDRSEQYNQQLVDDRLEALGYM